MPVTIYSPGTLPTTDASYPEGNKEYTTADSYAYWIAAGGAGTRPPDPSWYCAVADLPAVVESRTDGNHHLNELVFTAVGGETTVNLALAPPVCPSSLYLSTAPVLTQNDASTLAFANDSGGRVLPQLINWTIVSGVLTGTLNSGPSPALVVGHRYSIGAVSGNAPKNLAALVIQIATIGGGSFPTITADFIGTIPADVSNANIIYLTPNSGPNYVEGFLTPMATSTGSIDYLSGAVVLTLDSPLNPGDKIYATYGTRSSNFGSFVTPWTNLSALEAGSGAATATLQTQTFDEQYGLPMYTNSQWLVARDFGFDIPAGATIQRVGFAWEGTSVGANAGVVGTLNPATVVGNEISRTPFTQGAGDLGDGYYGDTSALFDSDATFGTGRDYWPDAFLRSGGNTPNAPWAGSTANDGSSEFACSETWNQDYLSEGQGSPAGIGYSSQGDPAAVLTPAQINDAGFGFAVAAYNGDFSDGVYGGSFATNTADVSVKSVRMIVFYTPASGLAVTPSSLSYQNNWMAYPNYSGQVRHDQAQNLTVTASSSWTATAADPWIQCVPASGSGNGTVSVSLYKAEQSLPIATNIPAVESGVYTSSVSVSDGTTTIVIPVTLKVGYGQDTSPTHYPPGFMRDSTIAKTVPLPG